ncbi:hypothetical protein COLU111180_20765 [Cohnella lubricantis]|uniref:Uncharacterized protein n=1 Tax=Cohnella lubricantis TaxID=2163172 RepID=A0A841TCT9_9BACL|nr:hypothetical protein [Cohnella lubricantis]MBB6677819.1 hypothetical protein [Cohnella lubricantis]MBP2120506.1 hypothetical protein [Cohnella lubricantis]
MDRTETVEFLTAVHREVEQQLIQQGYQRTKYRHSLEGFGNLYSVYESQDRVVRFIWDGLEGGLTFRIYGRRNWGMKLMKALIGGTAGDERLLREVIVQRNEVATLSEDELQRKLAEALNSK